MGSPYKNFDFQKYQKNQALLMKWIGCEIKKF